MTAKAAYPMTPRFAELVGRRLAGGARSGDVREGGEAPMDDSGAAAEALREDLRRCRARIAELEDRSSSLGEGLFGGLLDAAPDGILITDARGIIHLVNRHAEGLLGYERGELVGQPIECLVPERLRGAHAHHRAGFVERPAARRMGMGLKLTARRKDGSELPAEISLSTLETADGRYVVSAIRDVTERRQAELLLQEQAEALARSNNELQQFAYVALHDLQEPLRMVSSYLQLLERRYRDKLDDDALEFIGFAVDGAKRMQALINDLLAFSRIGSRVEAHAAVDLQTAVASELRDLEIAVSEAGASVHVGPLPTVQGEATQLRQLFLNLIGNALKFRRPGVAPEVHIGARRLAEGWELWVKDNGIGLEPKYEDRIFQIFQRLHTRQEYPGTGIGLAICKRIVERHAGSIRVESSPGHGATFLFTLPDRKHSP